MTTITVKFKGVATTIPISRRADSKSVESDIYKSYQIPSICQIVGYKDDKNQQITIEELLKNPRAGVKYEVIINDPIQVSQPTFSNFRSRGSINQVNFYDRLEKVEDFEKFYQKVTTENRGRIALFALAAPPPPLMVDISVIESCFPVKLMVSYSPDHRIYKRNYAVRPPIVILFDGTEGVAVEFVSRKDKIFEMIQKFKNKPISLTQSSSSIHNKTADFASPNIQEPGLSRGISFQNTDRLFGSNKSQSDDSESFTDDIRAALNEAKAQRILTDQEYLIYMFLSSCGEVDSKIAPFSTKKIIEIMKTLSYNKTKVKSIIKQLGEKDEKLVYVGFVKLMIDLGLISDDVSLDLRSRIVQKDKSICETINSFIQRNLNLPNLISQIREMSETPRGLKEKAKTNVKTEAQRLVHLIETELKNQLDSREIDVLKQHIEDADSFLQDCYISYLEDNDLDELLDSLKEFVECKRELEDSAKDVESTLFYVEDEDIDCNDQETPREEFKFPQIITPKKEVQVSSILERRNLKSPGDSKFFMVVKDNNYQEVKGLATPGFNPVKRSLDGSSSKFREFPIDIDDERSPDQKVQNAEEESLSPSCKEFDAKLTRFVFQQEQIPETITKLCEGLIKGEIEVKDFKFNLFDYCKSTLTNLFRGSLGFDEIRQILVQKQEFESVFEVDDSLSGNKLLQNAIQRAKYILEEIRRVQEASSPYNTSSPKGELIDADPFRPTDTESHRSLSINSGKGKIGLKHKKGKDFAGLNLDIKLMKDNLKEGRLANKKKGKMPNLIKIKPVRQSSQDDDVKSAALSQTKSHLTAATYMYNVDEQSRIENLNHCYHTSLNYYPKLQPILEILIAEEKTNSNSLFPSEINQNLKEHFRLRNPELIEILFEYKFDRDFEAIKDRLDNIKKTSSDQVTVMSSMDTNMRKKQFTLLTSLINALKRTFRIQLKQQSFFQSQIMKETFTFLGLFEFFFYNEDLEDFIENINLMYEYYYAEDSVDQTKETKEEVKNLQGSVIFKYRSQLGKDAYDKLGDLIRCGDTKTQQLKIQYLDCKPPQRDKFIEELKAYGLEKLSRKIYNNPLETKQYREKFKSCKDKEKTPPVEDWKETFVNLSNRNGILKSGSSYYKHALELYPELAHAILSVFEKNTDLMDNKENLQIFYNKYVNGNKFGFKI